MPPKKDYISRQEINSQLPERHKLKEKAKRTANRDHKRTSQHDALQQEADRSRKADRSPIGHEPDPEISTTGTIRGE